MLGLNHFKRIISRSVLRIFTQPAKIYRIPSIRFIHMEPEKEITTPEEPAAEGEAKLSKKALKKLEKEKKKAEMKEQRAAEVAKE